MNLDTIIATSLNRPQRNIYGDLGPRCPTCSGLGSVLRMAEGVRVRSASRCHCDGSGLDLALIERMDREAMWKAIHKIESKMGRKLTSRYRFPDIKMSRQYWEEMIAWATSDGAAVTNTVTETILFPNVTIPANYLQDGRALRVTATGKYSTTSASPGVNFIWTFRWGGVAGTLITKSGGLVTPTTTALTNGVWQVEAIFQTRSNGSSGTVMANGMVFLNDTTAQTMRSATNVGAFGPLSNGGQATPAVATLDLTADTAFALTITHSATGASNSTTGLTYNIESMN